MGKIPITKNGFLNLQKTLNFLKNIKRPKIIKAIKIAREHGDIKENAEYHAAKEEQYFIENKIKKIESKISKANIIDITKMNNNGKIIFGTTIDLININTQDMLTYCIVGEDEANIKKNKISIKSPIARSLISKSIGDIIKINTQNFRIKNVKYI